MALGQMEHGFLKVLAVSLTAGQGPLLVTIFLQKVTVIELERFFVLSGGLFELPQLFSLLCVLDIGKKLSYVKIEIRVGIKIIAALMVVHVSGFSPVLKVGFQNFSELADPIAEVEHRFFRVHIRPEKFYEFIYRVSMARIRDEKLEQV
jgi:hypothetical protein